MFWMCRGRSGWLALSLALLLSLVSPSANADAPQRDRTLFRRLDNGLEVVLSEARAQPLVSVSVVYRVGARNDPPDLAELAHLVEHLSFRDSGRAKGESNFALADAAGVEYNASTGTDETAYVYDGPAGALSRILWLERQRMVFALSSLTKADVEYERRMLDDERSSVRADVAGGLLGNLAWAALYPPGHPYAPRPERGCILHCELEHVQWMMQRGYRPDNARLVVVGDFDATALSKTIDDVFGSIENPSLRLPALPSVPARRAAERITVAAPVDRPALHLVWDVPDSAHAQVGPLSVLRAALELSLREALVDTPGLASDVHVQLNELELGWLWWLSVDLLPGIDPKFVEKRALSAVERLRAQALPRASFEAARLHAFTTWLRAWDAPSTRAALLSRVTLPFDPSKSRAELSRVSTADVQLLAQRCLLPKPRLSVHVRRALDAERRGELYREPQ